MGVAELTAAFDAEGGTDPDELREELVKSIISPIPSDTSVIGGVLQVDPVDSETGAIRQGYAYADGIFLLDATDTETAHDGITCIVLIGGYRYKVQGEIRIKAVEQVGIDEEPELTDSDYRKSYIDLTGVIGDANSIQTWTSRGWRQTDPDYGPPIYVKAATEGYPAKSYVHWDEGDGWVRGVGQGSILDETVPLSALIWDGRVENQTTDEPPATWSKGVAYIAGPGADGDPWTAGKLYIAESDGVLANGDTFTEYTPYDGLEAHDKDLKTRVRWVAAASAWQAATSGYATVEYFEDTASATLSSTGSNASQAAGSNFPATTPPTQTLNKSKILETLVAEDVAADRAGQVVEVSYQAGKIGSFSISTSGAGITKVMVMLSIFVDNEADARDWVEFFYGEQPSGAFDAAAVGAATLRLLKADFKLVLNDTSDHDLKFVMEVRTQGGTNIIDASITLARRRITVRKLN